MESRKIRYQFDRLPMVLFIACLAITVVAVKSKVSIDNLYSPLYIGDSNVTEGKHFSIRCWAEPPIAWFKDGEPIEKHFVRHNGVDEFTYTTRDHVREDQIGKVESTLSVSHAVLRHKGKYQCNVNHDNSHFINVHPAPRTAFENDESFDAFEAEDDHEEPRMSFEVPLEDDKPIASTMMIFTKVVTEAAKIETSDIESILDYDEEKSHEKFIDEPTSIDDYESTEFESTVQVLATSTKMTTSTTTTTISTTSATSTTPSPSLTNIPFHPTHANHVVHTTHVIPSEVKTQNHPEKHRHKGKLKPVYEDNREGYKLFKFLKPVVFTCIADTAAENEKVVWSKMDTEKKVWKNIREVSDLSGRFQIIPKEGKFVIEKGREEDVGNYSCSLGDVSYNFNTYAAVVVAVPKHVYAVEEEKIEIECNVKGTNPSISWEFRRENRPENETKSIGEDGERIKLSEYKNVEDAKLTIERANLTDRGFYFCIGTNELMDDTARAEAYVRVKDKLAALWPFLGICAEVFVLCAIILIYEKRRNKTDLDESDTDQSPDQKNDHHMKDSDVRHRK